MSFKEIEVHHRNVIEVHNSTVIVRFYKIGDGNDHVDRSTNKMI